MATTPPSARAGSPAPGLVRTGPSRWSWYDESGEDDRGADADTADGPATER